MLSGMEQAKHDGVQFSFGKRRIVYHIPCEICGEIIDKRQYSSSRSYVCDYCKGLVKRKKKLVIEQAIAETKTQCDVRFERAIEEIKNQVENFDEYENAIRIAKTRSERYDSIPEAMVAIELLRLKYSITPQQKVGKYRVDFAIPKEKMVIEVDGVLFHQNDRNNPREAEIQLMLGLDWKIIRIPAEKIRRNIQKLEEILNLFGTH